MTEFEALRKRVEALEAFAARVVEGLGLAAGVAQAAAPVEIDLDDPQYGDPKVKKNPPRVEGRELRRAYLLSQTSPEFLDTMAAFLDWRAGEEEHEPERKKFARYSRADAARARGWGVRLRQGLKAAPPPASAFDDASSAFPPDDEIPF